MKKERGGSATLMPTQQAGKSALSIRDWLPEYRDGGKWRIINAFLANAIAGDNKEKLLEKAHWGDRPFEMTG